jgi:hypothetical protein
LPAYFETGRQYFGIVYEYILPAEYGIGALQLQTDFFYRARQVSSAFRKRSWITGKDLASDWTLAT